MSGTLRDYSYEVALQPASAEPINGGPSLEDDEEESTEENPGVNGTLSRDGRSVSSTVHDRSRSAASATPTVTIGSGTLGKQVPRSQQPHNRQSRRPHSVHPSGTGSSPPTARETFLNYFFGQNGPGPIAGSSAERSSGQGIVPVGRDVSGTESSVPSSLMAGRRSMDGNSAAFDMKSLGKHIEAVRA